MWQRMEKFYFIQQIYRMMRELPLPSLRKMEDTKPWKRLRKDLQIESKPRFLLRLPYPLETEYIYFVDEKDMDVYELDAKKIEVSMMPISKKILYTVDYIEILFEDFGKIVFLTREEAEAKLKEMESSNE